MSSFVFGVIRSNLFATSNEVWRELCKRLIEIGMDNNTFFQFGWGISQPDVRRMIEEEAGSIDMTHMMPFLLLANPFDDTSDTLFQGTPLIEAIDDSSKFRPVIARICNSLGRASSMTGGELLLFLSYGYSIRSDFSRRESDLGSLGNSLFTLLDGKYTLPSAIFVVKFGDI
ncbi:hypothetical protein [Chelatococcus asaccharovorans]|uniref:Uncharacterized protein n=1 Tax=Chelatococcus asaccharovorans TaxID=28210 RepID=A0A2V3TZ11_9HYPH|nr:hypothetical protein [Chelatococcus asaccharovorans]MBS7707564.1 hypothetical protein [Chelatococcus asaccharovorans]PXW55132.1 hypothetical protein C7450_11071 [Chelatococcus asaccharovorans]